MTTRYQCTKCNIIFDVFDPVRFGRNPELAFPNCPNDPSVMPMIIGGGQPVTTHIVRLAIIQVAVPAPQPAAWGEPRVHTPETPQEAQKRNAQDKLAAAAEAHKVKIKHADEEARRLVNCMDKKMDGGSNDVSGGFPMDLQYGTKDNGSQETASADIIARAGVIWDQMGPQYSCPAPKPKTKVWGGLEMANFERLRVPGDEDAGKHNYHVIPK